jgi:hypothetical protein
MIADHDGGASVLASLAAAFFLHLSKRYISGQRDQVAGIQLDGVAAPFAQRP